jgi:predicted Zn-ribbon and HTH transcriptional regulator
MSESLKYDGEDFTTIYCKKCGYHHTDDRRSCPLNCGNCGGEKDSEGFCYQYCNEE